MRGEVHTGTLDQFWSLVKRGIMGSFHHVSKKYLPLYLNEFSFRHNMRKNPDAFGALVQRAASGRVRVAMLVHPYGEKGSARSILDALERQAWRRRKNPRRR